MKEFLVTLFFGWCGAHKFMKKKYVLGVVYLCTLGVFGIGWFVDTVLALARMTKGEKTENNGNKAKNSENYGGGVQMASN